MIKPLVKTEQSALRDFFLERALPDAQNSIPLLYKQSVSQCQNTINSDGLKGTPPTLKCEWENAICLLIFNEKPNDLGKMYSKQSK